jgi:hypothetical protein
METACEVGQKGQEGSQKGGTEGGEGGEGGEEALEALERPLQDSQGQKEEPTKAGDKVCKGEKGP